MARQPIVGQGLVIGTTASSGPGPADYRVFIVTLTHTPHSVGLLWTSDQPDVQTST
jgi:hypothetical protein